MPLDTGSNEGVEQVAPLRFHPGSFFRIETGHGRYPLQVGGEFLHCKTQFLRVSSRGTRLSERDLSVRLVEDHGVARLNSSLLREFLGNRDLKLLRNLVLLQSNTSLLQGNLRVSNCRRLLPNKSPVRGRPASCSFGDFQLLIDA